MRPTDLLGHDTIEQRSELWRAGDPRERLLDAFKCRAVCRQITARNLGRDESLCGICLEVCPVGKKRKR